MIMGAMGLACKHESQTNIDLINNSLSPKIKTTTNRLPATSPTRALVADLEEQKSWYRHMAIYGRQSDIKLVESKPVVVQIKGNQFNLHEDYQYDSEVYIDGQVVATEKLSTLSPEFVSELFVMHQPEYLDNKEAKTYKIFIQTSPKPIPFDAKRKQFFTLLQAAAISKYPLGETFSFNMNQLLEATFFHNKNALVERTKNEHLQVYDEFAKTVDVFINHIPSTIADVKTIHVREVARLYIRERPYNQWFRADNPESRFELHIQTAPTRAKRDSSYYVFSPFYSGDF
ncbi:hypothetical protein GCM10028805_34280 [Spirosoma harenae]